MIVKVDIFLRSFLFNYFDTPKNCRSYSSSLVFYFCQKMYWLLHNCSWKLAEQQYHICELPYHSKQVSCGKVSNYPKVTLQNYRLIFLTGIWFLKFEIVTNNFQPITNIISKHQTTKRIYPK